MRNRERCRPLWAHFPRHLDRRNTDAPIKRPRRLHPNSLRHRFAPHGKIGDKRKKPLSRLFLFLMLTPVDGGRIQRLLLVLHGRRAHRVTVEPLTTRLVSTVMQVPLKLDERCFVDIAFEINHAV